MLLTLFLAALLFAALIVSACTDIIKGKIYNWCTLSVIAVGVGAHGWMSVDSGSWVPAVSAVLGVLLGAGVFSLPYFCGLIGGGDVKLMGAVGAIRGPEFALLALFLSTVVGAVFGLSILIWKGKFSTAMKNFGGTMFTPWKLKEKASSDDTRIPYGVAIALGTFWAWFIAEGIIL